MKKLLLIFLESFITGLGAVFTWGVKQNNDPDSPENTVLKQDKVKGGGE